MSFARNPLTATTETPLEVWAVATRSGLRYFYFSAATFRSMPIRRADAEAGLAAGTMVDHGKPEFVGGKPSTPTAWAQVEPVAEELAELDEVAEDTETLTDDEAAALHAAGAELEPQELGTQGRRLAADLEAHLAASWALAELKTGTRAWIEAGMDGHDAYHMATTDVVARDKRAALALALYSQSGRLDELNG